MGIGQMIKTTLARVSNVGICSELQKSEVRKIHLTNQTVLILSFATVPYLLLFRLFGTPFLAWLIIPVFASFVSCIVLNHYRQYWASRMLFVIFANAAAFYYSAKLGIPANVHNLYFAFVGLPLMLFEPYRIRSILVSILIPLGCYFVIITQLAEKFISPTPPYAWSFFWISISASITVFAVIILYLISSYKSHQRHEASLLAANTELQHQQAIFKRRIAAIHDMTEQCNTVSEWQSTCENIFKYQLNSSTVKTWLATEVVSIEETPPYSFVDQDTAQDLLAHTDTFTWKSEDISVLFPLVSHSGLIAMIGLATHEPLTPDDLDFAVIVAKELQKTLQFIKSTDVMRNLNMSEFVQKKRGSFSRDAYH